MSKKDDKSKFFDKNFLIKSKKGQVTIFIIIGLMIVVAAFLIYLFLPKIKTIIGGEKLTPQSYIQSCLDSDFKDIVKKISLQGGMMNPTFFTLYDEEKIRNLCYTAEYGVLCTIQEPQLKSTIELEITNAIKEKVDFCFNSLKESYQKKGYVFELEKGEEKTELLLKKIILKLDYSLTLTKGESEKYDSFSIILNNNLYELQTLANNIIQFESNYGDSDVTMYMDYYPEFKIQKYLLGDGTKIYTVMDRKTENKFQFASRSLVYGPGGYF